MTPKHDSARDRVRSAGVHLGWRQATGVALGIVSVLTVTRIIGPTDYGTYAAAAAVATTLSALFQWGVGLYLVRQGPDIDQQTEHAALGFALAGGCAAVAAGVLLASTIARVANIPNLLPVILVLVPGLAFSNTRLVPLARLERQLRFKTIALVELSAQVLLAIVMLILAAGGAGVWAPVAGWWVQELVLFFGTWAASQLSPRLSWDIFRNRDILRFGTFFSVALWSWQARTAIIAVLLGRIAGAQAVGLVSLASRIVEGVGFFRNIAWRLSLPAFSAIRGKPAAMSARVTEAIGLQIVAVGAPLIAFSWLAPFVVVPIFGERWAPILSLVPWLAIAWTTHAAASMVTSALYITGEMTPLIVYHAGSTILLAIGISLFTPHLGLTGYALAEILTLLGIFTLLLVRSLCLRLDRFAVVSWITVVVAIGSWWILPWSVVALAFALYWGAGYRVVRTRLGGPRTRRVLIVGPDVGARGGVSTVIRGYGVAGLFDTVPSELTVVAVSSTRDGSRLYTLLYGLSKLFVFGFRQLGPDDLIHVHMGTGPSFYRKAGYIWFSHLKGALVVAHVHPSDFIGFVGTLGNWRRRFAVATFRRVNTAIALTPTVADFLRHDLGVESVYTLPNPVDVGSLEVSTSHEREPATVAYIGWFVREKGAYDLLEALRLVRDSGSAVRGVYAGCKQEFALTRRISDLGLESIVTVAGWLSRREVGRLLQTCTIVALPSHSEGTPMVLYEAMACGAPIVTCPVGGVEQIVRDERNAVFVRPGDIDGLASALIQLLNDTARRHDMSRHNVDDARSFDVAAATNQLVAIYLATFAAADVRP